MHRRMIGLLLLLGWCWAVGPVWAQEPKASPPKARQDKAESGQDAGAKKEPKRIIVYIPYHRLGKLLKEQGYFLTRRQFGTLMGRLRAAQKRKARELPFSYLLAHSSYRGVVQGDGVQLQVSITLRVLTPRRWVIVSLPFRGLPLTSATLDGKPALLLASSRRRRGMSLLVRGKGTHKLLLSFVGRARRRAGWRDLHLRIPATPQTDVSLRLGGKGWQMLLNGQKHPLQTDAKAQHEKLVTSLGPRHSLRLRWFPKKQLTSAQTRILSARVNVESSLEEGLCRSQIRVGFHVLRGKTQRLALRFPPSHKLIAVEGGARLKSWSVQSFPTHKRLSILLHRSFKGRYHMHLELEKLLAKKQKRVRVPVVSVEEARWQHGWIALRLKGALQLKLLKEEGTTQMDAAEYAKQSKSAPPQKAFTYLGNKYHLEVGLQKIKPRLRAKVFHRLTIDDEQAVVDSTVEYRIERAGVFRLHFTIPKGWELRDVRCPQMQDHYREGKDKLRLVVLLKQKVGGPVVKREIDPARLWHGFRRIIGWHLFRRLRKRDRIALKRRIARRSAVTRLQRVLGVDQRKESGPYRCKVRLRRAIKVAKPFALPLLKPLGLASEKGLVGLLVPKHLDLVTDKRRSLMSVDDLDTASEVSKGKFPLRQAFRYAVRPASGQLTLKRKDTAIETKIWLPVSLAEDGYRIKGTVRYRVRFAATDKLLLSVPKAISKQLQLTTQTREVRKKAHKDHIVYTLLLERKVPRDGTFDLSFVYHHRFKKTMKIGDVRRLSLLPLRTPKAIEQTLYWGLQKGESLSLQTRPQSGLERFDAADLPAFATPRKMARLLKTREKTPSKLQLILRKHRYAQVLSAVVSRLHLKLVATLTGKIHAFALFKVKNRGRQFLKLRLPQRAKVLALRVAGVDRYRFELDRKGELLVDLVNRSRGRSFLIALRYRYDLKQAMSNWAGKLYLEGPKVLQVPVLQTTTVVRLPARHAYSAFDTKMWHAYNTPGIWDVIRKLLWGRDLMAHMHYPSDVSGMLSKVNDMHRQLPQQGQRFRFYTRDARVALTAHYRRSFWQGILEFFVFLLVSSLLLWFERRSPASMGPMRLAILTLLLCSFLGSILPDALVPFTYPAFFSLSLMSLFWSGRSLWNSLKAAPYNDEFGGGDDEPPSGSTPSTPPPSSPPSGQSKKKTPALHPRTGKFPSLSALPPQMGPMKPIPAPGTPGAPGAPGTLPFPGAPSAQPIAIPQPTVAPGEVPKPSTGATPGNVPLAPTRTETAVLGSPEAPDEHAKQAQKSEPDTAKAESKDAEPVDVENKGPDASSDEEEAAQTEGKPEDALDAQADEASEQKEEAAKGEGSEQGAADSKADDEQEASSKGEEA